VDNENTAEQNPSADINADAAQQLKSFPESMEGYDRYVIYLPKQDNEEALRLEVIPGIMKEVDCNTHWLIGEFETKEIEGMGYDYMVFESNGDVAATRMACPDNQLIEKFVAANGNFGRYNSQLPVVIFVPKGVELKYNVWKAHDTQVAEKL
jgi:ecotin